MKNVEKCSVQGSFQKICHGLAREATIFTVGAAFLPVGELLGRVECRYLLGMANYLYWCIRILPKNLGLVKYNIPTLSSP